MVTRNAGYHARVWLISRVFFAYLWPKRRVLAGFMLVFGAAVDNPQRFGTRLQTVTNFFPSGKAKLRESA
jgi:hypothetical protein